MRYGGERHNKPIWPKQRSGKGKAIIIGAVYTVSKIMTPYQILPYFPVNRGFIKNIPVSICPMSC